MIQAGYVILLHRCAGHRLLQIQQLSNVNSPLSETRRYRNPITAVDVKLTQCIPETTESNEINPRMMSSLESTVIVVCCLPFFWLLKPGRVVYVSFCTTNAFYILLFSIKLILRKRKYKVATYILVIMKVYYQEDFLFQKHFGN